MTAPAYRTQKVLLVGMMGSGKTIVGAALAGRLGWPYLDNDAMLERTAGRSAADIAAADGEEALRTAESKVLTFMLGMPTPMIAGVAGGVVLAEADRLRIRESTAHVVWLRASPKVLARRLGRDAGRPWLDGDPEAALRKLAAERHTHYEAVADQVVDVDALAVGVIAKQIAEDLTTA